MITNPVSKFLDDQGLSHFISSDLSFLTFKWEICKRRKNKLPVNITLLTSKEIHKKTMKQNFSPIKWASTKKFHDI